MTSGMRCHGSEPIGSLTPVGLHLITQPEHMLAGWPLWNWKMLTPAEHEIWSRSCVAMRHDGKTEVWMRENVLCVCVKLRGTLCVCFYT